MDDIGYALVLLTVAVLFADAVRQVTVYNHRRRQRRKTHLIKTREYNMAPDEPTEAIMEFFTWAHLQNEDAQHMSRSFAELAERVLRAAPRGAERAVALRKLLEGKDAAVRAVLSKARPAPWRERASAGEAPMEVFPVVGVLHVNRKCRQCGSYVDEASLNVELICADCQHAGAPPLPPSAAG
jgi:hypothetical protein